MGLDADTAIAFIIQQGFIILYRCDAINVGGDCCDEQIGRDTKDIKVDITETRPLVAAKIKKEKVMKDKNMHLHKTQGKRHKQLQCK